MCEQRKSIKAVNEAADRLTIAALRFIAEDRRVRLVKPLQPELEASFPVLDLLPNDMLQKLSSMK